MVAVRESMELGSDKSMTSALVGSLVAPRDDLSDMLIAFRGLGDAAQNIEDALPPGWGDEINLDALLGTTSRAALVKSNARLIGMRTAWDVGDVAMLIFTAELFSVMPIVPAPDMEIVNRLSQLEGFEREGNIVALNCVPIPAGEDQVRFFVTLRWRWLFSPLAHLHLIALRNPAKVKSEDHITLGVEPGHKPHLRHLLGYDAQHTSDETQQTLLTYSTAAHRENLIALQNYDLPLFLAVWRRDFPEIEKQSHYKPLKYLRSADSRSKHMKCDRVRLIYGTAIMSEFERAFEIGEFFRMDGGVSRQAIQRIFKSCPAMLDVQSGTSEAHAFVYGMVAHTRCIHPTMNNFVPGIASDPALNQIHTAFREAKSYWKSPQRLQKPSGEMPAMYFLGIEPQYLMASAIWMMIRNLRHLDGNFARRRKHDGSGGEIADSQIVRLGALIMANICVPTARATAGKIDSEIDDDDWLQSQVPLLTENSALRAEYQKEQGKFEESNAEACGPRAITIEFPDVGDYSSFQNQIEKTRLRVKSCPAAGYPGWTRGFHFQAWFTPAAEVGFLRKTCKFTQYCNQAARKRKTWTIGGKAKKLKNYTGSPETTFTGLPRKHPVENTQDKFRPFFTNLQYPDLLQPRWTVKERAIIDAFITEVARMMPSINPCTVDPYLNEMIIYQVDPLQKAFATEAAWN